MIAKGLDIPDVTLAAIVAADLDLNVPDFRAAERTFSLIAQVAGRSGRRGPGEAIVQTYAPTHPAIALAALHDFDAFATHELAERRAVLWPPFVRLVALDIAGADPQAAQAAAMGYADLLRGESHWEVLGPAPGAIARINNAWRWRIMIKTRALDELRAALRRRVIPRIQRERDTHCAILIDP